jgi:hypothetical protein
VFGMALPRLNPHGLNFCWELLGMDFMIDRSGQVGDDASIYAQLLASTRQSCLLGDNLRGWLGCRHLGRQHVCLAQAGLWSCHKAIRQAISAHELHA